MPQNKIMIVEDEVIVSADIRAKLEQLGYEVVPIVRYGEKVYDAALNAQPDLVLMDIKLKGDMDGIQAAKQVREGLNLPVVFMTAYSDDETLKRARAVEPYAYLKKPVKLDDMRIAIDIGLHKAKIDEKLRQSEIRFKTVADFTYDWETWVDDKGKYVYMSPSCERITGYTREDFYENPELLFDIVIPADKEKVKTHFNKCHFHDSNIHMEEFRLMHTDGQERWVEHICRPVYSSQGEYIGRRASNREISVRKEIENEREKLINELQDALKNIKTLSGLLPICANCKNIRDDQGYWKQLEKYISDHSEAVFSHSICPDCIVKLYPEYASEMV